MTEMERLQKMSKFNMQNVMMWVIPEGGGYKFRYRNDFETVKNGLKIQIHNSLDLGWDPKDIVLATNFPFKFKGVKAYELKMECPWSAFANKLMFVHEMIKAGVINDNFWFHDVDAYQLVPFDFPEECKDVGFVRHAVGRSKPQGASSFYRKDSYDVIEAIVEGIRIFQPKKEESFFPNYFESHAKAKFAAKVNKRIAAVKPKNEKKLRILNNQKEHAQKYFSEFSPGFSWLNFTYNISHQRMFAQKYPKAQKPIKVLHFHTEYDSCLNCYYHGLNKFKVRVVDDRLERLLLKYRLIKPEQKRS
jgi:hypothetical protein